MHDPTPAAVDLEGADPAGRARLFDELYDELRRIAGRELRRAGGHLALSPTTLLHEAYLSFADRQGLAFPDRARFIAYASQVMRGLIVDYARSRQALKRGGAYEIVALPTQVPEQVDDCREIERLGEAVLALQAVDPDLAQVVDLKYFCGLSFVEIATLRGTHEKTVRRAWEKARLFLFEAMRGP